MRLAQVERQIGEAVTLDWPTLVDRAQQRDDVAPDFLAPEALVYFIRQAIRSEDVRIRNDCSANFSNAALRTFAASSGGSAERTERTCRRGAKDDHRGLVRSR